MGTKRKQPRTVLGSSHENPSQGRDSEHARRAEGYRQAAVDEPQEREALEWSEGLIGDVGRLDVNPA